MSPKKWWQMFSDDNVDERLADESLNDEVSHVVSAEAHADEIHHSSNIHGADAITSQDEVEADDIEDELVDNRSEADRYRSRGGADVALDEGELEDEDEDIAVDLETELEDIEEFVEDDDFDNQVVQRFLKVDSIEEFFSTEIIRRADLISDEIFDALKGEYRFEFGRRQRSYTVEIGEQLEVIDADRSANSSAVKISVHPLDLIRVVNGDLNPQIAILAGKIRYQGELKRGLLFQHLLSGPQYR